MPKAYAVVTYRSISDPEKLATYAKLALPAVLPFGARILARGDAAVAREQGLKERKVVVEYPSLEKATAAYDSVAYGEALKALGEGAVRWLRMRKVRRRDDSKTSGYDVSLERNELAPSHFSPLWPSDIELNVWRNRTKLRPCMPSLFYISRSKTGSCWETFRLLRHSGKFLPHPSQQRLSQPRHQSQPELDTPSLAKGSNCQYIGDVLLRSALSTRSGGAGRHTP